MKKRYPIDRERAVRRFREDAAGGDREIQLHLPLEEIAATLQDDVGALMRQAGLELMQLIMEDEVPEPRVAHTANDPSSAWSADWARSRCRGRGARAPRKAASGEGKQKS